MLHPGGREEILIVDRDVAELECLRQTLSGAGFAVRTFSDGFAALDVIALRTPRLVIIDWDLPGFSAPDLINCVRRAASPRIIRLIVLSALSGEQHAVTALNLGADDYVAKPYSVNELTARACGLLRCTRGAVVGAPMSCGDMVLDVASHQVRARGRTVGLRAVECRLLEFLMSHPGRIFNRGQLLTHVWGQDREIDERTVDVNVQRLRKILGAPGLESCI